MNGQDYKGFLVSTDHKEDIFSIHPNGVEIVKIDYNGDIFWNGRKVETDEEFKGAMLDVASFLSGKMQKEL